MKSWAWVLLLVLINACQKGDLHDPNIIGKWELRSFVAMSDELNIRSYLGNNYYYNNESSGSLTVDIDEDLNIEFDTPKGKEKFRTVQVDQETYTVYYLEESNWNWIYNQVQGYRFTLRSNKGQKFKFVMCYDPSTQKLITVPWMKKGVFNKWDKPYSGNKGISVLGEQLSSLKSGNGGPQWNYASYNTIEQDLGVFVKM
ncbi:MAG: hypothetical protein EP305_07180 [Bacteroidetes bacterium]|nr:MAG: hypothetical protein EP305_07180 [Bacteroidota bacterium]